MICRTVFLAVIAVLLSGCSHPGPPVADQVSPRQLKESDYRAVSQRIIRRVVALQTTYPVLAGIKEREVAIDGTGALSFEQGVTWVLDDPSKPAGKLNARRENFSPDGFWISLQFYRGTWEGAAVFLPTEFGDLKLWFSYGYRKGDNPVVIAAVARIIDEEKKAFEAARTR